MNPNAPQPSFELPSLPGESGGDGASSEQVPARPEVYAGPPPPGVQSAAGPAPQFTQPTAVPQQAVPIDPAVSIPMSQGSMAADDTELIEKEWVTKAKQIVAATKEDPYTQTKEISKFKADYLKKRYNKDLKVEES